MKLRAYANAIDLAEERRLRVEPVRIQFIGWSTAPAQPLPSHPAAQALLAGLMQGIAERENDPALLDAGKRLGEAAEKGQPGDTEPEPPRKPRRWLGLFRRP